MVATAVSAVAAAEAATPSSAVAAKIATAPAVTTAAIKARAIVVGRRVRGRGTGTCRRSRTARMDRFAGQCTDRCGGFGRTRGRRRRLNVRRLDGRRRGARRGKHRSALVLHLLHFLFGRSDGGLELLDSFEEVADVQESVAIEADFDEGRLHARQHARYTAFVDASD